MLYALRRIIAFVLTLPFFLFEKTTSAGAWIFNKLALAALWPYRKFFGTKPEEKYELLPETEQYVPEPVYIPTPDEELFEWYRVRAGGEPNFPTRDIVNIIADTIEDDISPTYSSMSFNPGPTRLTPYEISDEYKQTAHIKINNTSRGPARNNGTRPIVKNEWMKKSAFSHQRIALNKGKKRLT